MTVFAEREERERKREDASSHSGSSSSKCRLLLLQLQLQLSANKSERGRRREARKIRAIPARLRKEALLVSFLELHLFLLFSGKTRPITRQERRHQSCITSTTSRLFYDGNLRPQRQLNAGHFMGLWHGEEAKERSLLLAVVFTVLDAGVCSQANK